MGMINGRKWVIPSWVSKFRVCMFLKVEATKIISTSQKVNKKHWDYHSMNMNETYLLTMPSCTHSLVRASSASPYRKETTKISSLIITHFVNCNSASWRQTISKYFKLILFLPYFLDQVPRHLFLVSINGTFFFERAKQTAHQTKLESKSRKPLQKPRLCNPRTWPLRTTADCNWLTFHLA